LNDLGVEANVCNEGLVRDLFVGSVERLSILDQVFTVVGDLLVVGWAD